MSLTNCLMLLLTLLLSIDNLSTQESNAKTMQNENFTVEPIEGAICDLGEGPHWYRDQSSLYFVDAFVGDVHRYDYSNSSTIPEQTKVNLGDVVTIVIPINENKMLISLRNKVVNYDWTKKEISEVIAEADSEKMGKERFNDAKIDPMGRLWIGTVLQEEKGVKENAGSLYKLDSNNKFVKMSSNFTIPNGMAWNKNRTLMYFNDSEGRKIYVFDFNLQNGTISNKRIFLDLDKSDEFGSKECPDGMTMDSEDRIWTSLYGGGRIVCLDQQTAKIVTSISVPAPQTTSLTFGGPNFDELYVTTGNSDVKPNATLQEKYPNAGKTYRIRTKPGASFQLKGDEAFNFKING